MRPREFYDLLLDYSAGAEPVREVILGQVWTYCRSDAAGLAMSPESRTRTLPWAGTLRGRSLAELAGWVRDFEPCRAAVGMAAVNAAVNALGSGPPGPVLEAQPGVPRNLAVFEHFLPQIRDRRVVIVGRYPGLEEFVSTHQLRVTVLERQPGPNDLPDPACEFVLPEADWVFLTASSIPNKTFPRLAELSREGTTVLMGPTTPWLPDLYHFGIDYLAGIDIGDAETVRDIVAEGGGVRLFDGAAKYRIAPLTCEAATDWARSLIAHTVQEKESLLQEMAEWYGRGQARRFPRYDALDAANRRLARLDTCFKRLWDGGSGGREAERAEA